MKRKFWMPATLAILALTLAPATPAQKKKERSNTRSLHGIVVDKSGTPLEKAVVYLKNTRTLRVRTHIADKEGAFRFHGLSFNVDYQVWAQHQGVSSRTRTISSFSTRPEVHITLKIKRKE